MQPEETNSPVTQSQPPEADTRLLVLFGEDEAGKAHAAFFESKDAVLAERAASLMSMKVLRLTKDEQQSLAGKIPAGKIFSNSNKALVPFCNRTLFQQLKAMGGEIPSATMADIAAALNANEEKPPEDHVAGNAEETAVAPSWAEITVGSVVLANEGPMEGWFEAVVTAAKPNNLFELRWRDWPEEKAIVRKRGHLGLLPPAEAIKAS